jgi:hypothetical protein
LLERRTRLKIKMHCNSDRNTPHIWYIKCNSVLTKTVYLYRTFSMWPHLQIRCIPYLGVFSMLYSRILLCRRLRGLKPELFPSSLKKSVGHIPQKCDIAGCSTENTIVYRCVMLIHGILQEQYILSNVRYSLFSHILLWHFCKNVTLHSIVQ